MTEQTIERQRVVITVTHTGQGVTAWGQTMSIRAWSLISGVPRSTIYKRIKQGIPPDVAVSAPVMGKRK